MLAKKKKSKFVKTRFICYNRRKRVNKIDALLYAGDIQDSNLIRDF